MAKSALKLNSTQKFIEIDDIVEDIIVLSSQNACIIVEVQATNFELLSQDEQNAKIYSYSALLNSLSFPIQIVIRSKQVDISSYLGLLDIEAKKTQNQALAKQIELYKDFVAELIKINTVLDKNFYIVISYSSLEKGAFGEAKALAKNSKEAFVMSARSALRVKAETIKSQLTRIGLKSEILDKDKLIKLFYDIFNEQAMHKSHSLSEAQSTFVLGKEKK
ncbi:MAG: hypothetical protein HY344_05075 [Candidatus Levybacteria bacterium]|nr:hypothetical protein [Candidatus Levybacteria bacterium]